MPIIIIISETESIPRKIYSNHLYEVFNKTTIAVEKWNVQGLYY